MKAENMKCDLRFTFEDKLESYSVDKLEKFVIQAYQQSFDNQPMEDCKEQVIAALSVRRRMLNNKFEWTTENKEKLLLLNDKLMECFEKLKTEALAIVQACNKRIEAKDNFLHDFEIEGYVQPYIYEYRNGKYYEKEEMEIEDILVDYWNKWDLCFSVHNDEKINDDIHFNKELSWNIELLDGLFNKHYISYAIHALCMHTNWSLQDILKINHLEVELCVLHQHSKDI